jgi:hypothetical protein
MTYQNEGEYDQGMTTCRETETERHHSGIVVNMAQHRKEREQNMAFHREG